MQVSEAATAHAPDGVDVTMVNAGPEVLAVHGTSQIVHLPLPGVSVPSVNHSMIVPPATTPDGPVFPQNVPRVGMTTPS
jgi:hypothetical protein